MEAYFQNMVEELRQIRRDLHKIPELGLKEYKTSAYIREKLEGFGITELETWLETGVVAVIRGKGKKEAVAFRADMDALPVTEQTGCDFTSEHVGCMHACGHDGHVLSLIHI